MLKLGDLEDQIKVMEVIEGTPEKYSSNRSTVHTPRRRNTCQIEMSRMFEESKLTFEKEGAGGQTFRLDTTVVDKK